ncbi:Up-regulated during septation-domain-containing protein [Umbelopsis sp. AD052]|nr:Up-regulated during septation-domain-containing protein [Umbelopsis sp. AD052]
MNPPFSRLETSGSGPRPLTSSRSQISPTRGTFPLSSDPRSNTTRRPPPSSLGPIIPRESGTASQIGFSYATVIEPSLGGDHNLPIAPPSRSRVSLDYDREKPLSPVPLEKDLYSPTRGAQERSSLDIPPLWKSMRETVIKEDDGPHQPALDSTEDYLIQLLVQQSVIDSKDFDILSLEQVEELKKDHISLTSRIANVTTRLTLESKMREAAQSLTHLHSSNRKMAQEAQTQLAAANRQVDHVASELFNLTQSGSSTQRKLLEHMAGTLSVGIKRLEAQLSQKQQPDQQQINQELAVMTRKVREREATIADRDREIERLKMQLRAQTMDESAEAVIEQRERSISELRSEFEQVSNRLDFIIRRESLLSASDPHSRLEDDDNSHSADDQPKDTATISQQLGKMISTLEDRLVDYRQKATRLEVELEEMEQQKNESLHAIKSYESRPDQASYEALRLKLDTEQQARNNAESKCKELGEKIQLLENMKRETEQSGGASSEELLKLSAEVEKLERHQREREAELESSLTDARGTIEELRVAQSALIFEIMDFEPTSEEMTNIDECKDRIRDIKSNADKLNSELNALEKSLSESKIHEELLEREKTTLLQESQRLRTKMSEMEVKSNTSNSVATAASARERSLQMELQQFRAEAFDLREQKEKWEKTMRRDSVLQVVQGGGDSLKAQYEQMMQEQVEEYEAQLKEQSALLEKTLREKDALDSEKQKLSAMSKDLEDLVRDKIRTLDSKEGTISRLEMELAEVKVRLVEAQTSDDRGASSAMLDELSQLRMENTTMEAELNITQDQLQALQSRFESAQKQFSQMEDTMHKRSERLEDDFEGIMKEYERITGNLMNLESERHSHERRFNELQEHAHRLEFDLADYKIKAMGVAEQGNESGTTASLRKEFRKLMNEMKSEHHEVLMREVLERKRLEATVRDMRRDEEMRRWDKVSKGVQTNLLLV